MSSEKFQDLKVEVVDELESYVRGGVRERFAMVCLKKAFVYQASNNTLVQQGTPLAARQSSRIPALACMHGYTLVRVGR